MDYSTWEPRYLEIARRLQIDIKCDSKAAAIISAILGSRSKSTSEVRRSIEGRTVVVIGAGPSVEDNIHNLRGLDGFVSITADGATAAYRAILGRYPDFVVTDLDGYGVQEEVNASHHGSVVLVHSHCDNIGSIKAMVPLMDNVIATTQGMSLSNVQNFGGFTDGDRAAFFAAEMGSRRILLAGMDLGETIGRFSKLVVSNPERKLEKLRIAGELLGWLTELYPHIEYFNISGHGRIENYREIPAHDVGRLL